MSYIYIYITVTMHDHMTSKTVKINIIVKKCTRSKTPRVTPKPDGLGVRV
jgi:hypothetical protein